MIITDRITHFVKTNYKNIILIGLVILCLIPTVTASLFGANTIENNKTIDINGLIITVPETGNYSINESTTLSNVNDTEKFGMFSPVSENNSWEYYDGEHDISLYVADSNRTAYSDIPDYHELTTLDGDSERTNIVKKTVGDKTLVVYVTEGDNLAELIAESAKVKA